MPSQPHSLGCHIAKAEKPLLSCPVSCLHLPVVVGLGEWKPPHQLCLFGLGGRVGGLGYDHGAKASAPHPSTGWLDGAYMSLSLPISAEPGREGGRVGS